MFDGGKIQCHFDDIHLNKGLGEKYEIPVPWFLVEHDRGLVVIDGGIAAECAIDPEQHWERTARLFWPVITAEQACVPALKAGGFDPGDVRYVLQSHLHSDHTGALGAIDHFPNAEAIVTRAEYEYAFAPDWFASAGYIYKDFDKPGIRWSLLEDSEDGYDLFGDGVIRCWSTPGHSPGHQSFEIALPNSGTILLTVDAAYTTAHWNERALPGVLTSAIEAVRSVRKLHRIAARSDATVVTGHDPEMWPTFRHSPDSYD